MIIKCMNKTSYKFKKCELFEMGGRLKYHIVLENLKTGKTIIESLDSNIFSERGDIIEVKNESTKTN